MLDGNINEEIWVNKFDEESASDFRKKVLLKSSMMPEVPIIVYIDSYGGCVDSLAKMIETMDEVENKFITVCMGKAMSCGAILLSHGDVRYCGNYSRVMIHNVSSGSWGDVYTLQSSSTRVTAMNKKFMGLLAENCGIEYSTLQQLIKDSECSKEIWLDAKDALKFGIIDQVGSPSLRPVINWECHTRLVKNKNESNIKNNNSNKKKTKKKTKKK